jgi:hypothetical protein
MKPALMQSVLTGLSGRCPRCREGSLFAGFLSVGKKCEACGLDYAFADAGDGLFAAAGGDEFLRGGLHLGYLILVTATGFCASCGCCGPA